MKPFNRFVSLVFLGLIFTFPLENASVAAQQNLEVEDMNLRVIQFQKLSLHKLVTEVNVYEFTKPEDLELTPLSVIEENIARNLDSHWVWPEYTLEMIDSYSPFLFRTKKTQDLEEVKLLVEVDSKGKVSGFEVLGEVDKGLKERLDYLIRKLPVCKPVPGFSSYIPEKFELTIRK
ncbi:hypothetical protein D0X99_19090 [Algoriphagus lacus]|uniref:TonB C-terminal domain-containing protein n=1 Tax=Algoriphagus lacus TaxID=2056311 RepID=A0A418PLP7_9BACT|nr:hypothetical protein [Algoriphagus lacus]RIW12378.1 hypothetical protein D0X99_19090 [Algoriphagus lacus]